MMEPMGFFVLPDPPAPDLVDEDEIELTAPWIGTAIAINAVAARSAEAAIVVSGIVVHQDSFELTITTHVRRPGPYDHFMGPRTWHGEIGITDRHLRVGLLWADGGRATNLDGWGHHWPDATAPEHWLDEGSGGGGGATYEQQFFAGPVPDSAGLQLVVEWPAYGIGDTYLDLPAAEMAAGARLARPVWADDAHLPPSSPSHGRGFGFHTGAGTIVFSEADDEDPPDA
jgi:hypothetical protein